MNSSQIHVVEVGKKRELQLQIDVPTKKGSARIRIPIDEASPEIKDYINNPSKVKGEFFHVEFEGDGAQVKRVRLRGQPWVEPTAAPTTKPNPGNAPQPGAARFENPYNFIPALPRDTEHKTLGDAKHTGLAGHHRYHADKWSGRISVELTTVTPLLIPDAGEKGANGHKTFGIRKDEDEAPYLPPTSIKGALRSAYEAITNSRMGVFKDHDVSLAFRNAARGVDLIPARVGEDGKFELLYGMSDNSQRAAWLPANYVRNIASLMQRGSAVTGKNHGKKIWAWIELWRHHRGFNFWRVISYAESEAKLQELQPRPSLGGRSNPTGGEMKIVQGWICANNQNMTNKHDERLFFNLPNNPAKTIEVTEDIRRHWANLITDYRLANKRELDNGATHPSALRTGEFSRHIINAGEKQNQNVLTTGTLCYLKLDDVSNPKRVEAIYPVLISRELYSCAPADLLDKSLNLCETIKSLSPADRVFGWVSKKGHGQFKGQLRIGAVTCVQGAAAIQSLGDGQEGIPLAILGAPKPAQARFYAAKNSKGDPLVNSSEKAKAYATDQGLRGRKVYPHQKQAALNTASYWDASTSEAKAIEENIEGQTVYREWQRLAEPPDEVKKEQNRSIKEWVKPGMTFKFDMDVTNLSSVELGALLWLLNQPAERYFRFGGGKPLGFGSATLKITSLDLRDGEAIRADYLAFGESDDAQLKRIKNIEAAQPLIEAYKQALPSAVGDANQQFDNLRIIKAFVNAAKGGNLPVHYPRSTPEPNPKGEIFKWFVANEGNGPKNSLPDLALANRGLPFLGNGN